LLDLLELTMLKPIAIVFVCGLTCNAVGAGAADHIKADAKEAGQEIGHATREVGKAGKKAGRAVGKVAKKGGKDVGSAAKNFGKGVKRGFKKD
jgi:hypothetical protein